MRYFILLLLALAACSEKSQDLPVYGMRHLDAQGDTVYHQIGEFSFVNQDSQAITQATFAGKVYVADFFFTTCPSICPPMTGQKLRVHEKFKGNPNVMLLSHTVDPQRDSVQALKAFAERVGAGPGWHFATGQQEYMHRIAVERYLMAVGEDKEAAGGFVHSDKLVLIDQQGRIRGFYSGTDKVRVDQLMADIERLLKKNQ